MFLAPNSPTVWHGMPMKYQNREHTLFFVRSEDEATCFASASSVCMEMA